MAIVFSQDIPSSQYDYYKGVLSPAYNNTLVGKGDVVKKPYRKKKRKAPSAAQLKVREAFRDSCDCWWKQKEEGISIPPEWGPRPLWWWYQHAVMRRMMVFHYFQHRTISPFYNDETIPWCEYGPKRDVHVDSALPSTNFGKWETIQAQVIYQRRWKRFFIMKDPDEYFEHDLNLYCTVLGKGGDFATPILSCYSIKRNVIGEMTMTWQNQPTMYEELTYHAVTSTGWHVLNTGIDWIAFGFKIKNEETLPDYNKYDCRFASMNHPEEGKRPFWGEMP